MIYRRCGHSGIVTACNFAWFMAYFGDVDDFGTARDMLLTAFESGVCHFDLANNYGPSPGSAEITFGKVLSADLATHRAKCSYHQRPDTRCGRACTAATRRAKIL